ncbi:hypothetical protein BX616_009395, partial [Lobosporangium transversale]
ENGDSDLGSSMLLGFSLSVVQLVALWIHLSWQERFMKPDEAFQNGVRALVATMVLPTVWVALFTVVYAVSPLGTVGSIAYSQLDNQPFVRWVAVAGIGGLEFIM